MADIKGVEIMSLGTWNGNKITEEMFDQVINAFNATKEFASVPLKLGHTEEQKFLQEDGHPSAGWVSRVYREGKKLFADFSEIPSKIYELIKKKAYRKVSVELFMGYKFQGKEFPCLLGAVALLGSDLPAMATLNDILNLYSGSVKCFTVDENHATIPKTITFDIGDNTVAEPKDNSAELATLKEQLEAQKKQLAGMDEQVKSFKKQQEDAETYRKEADKKIADLEAEKNKAGVENFCLELEKKDLLAPSMKPLVAALVAEAQQNFSVADKKLNAKELVEQLLSLAKGVYKINKTEHTDEGKQKEIATTELFAKKMKELMEKEPSLSQAEAYKRVMKQA